MRIGGELMLSLSSIASIFGFYLQYQKQNRDICVSIARMEEKIDALVDRMNGTVSDGTASRNRRRSDSK